MTSPEILSWINVLGALGIGSALGGAFGTWVTLWLSARKEHKAWVRDNKKLEWRELIDALREAIRVMAWHYDDKMPDAVKAPDQQRYREETIRKAEVMIRSRIFISKKLNESGLFNRWTELVKECEEADVSFLARPKTYPLFEKKAHSFQADLVCISRADLGLD